MCTCFVKAAGDGVGFVVYSAFVMTARFDVVDDAFRVSAHTHDGGGAHGI